MITKSDVEKAQAKRKAAQELKDLDVDRVDGVDRPATGRHFLLFKAVDPEDAVGTFPAEDQGGSVRRMPARQGDDSAFDRLAAFNGRGTSTETGLPDGHQENFQTADGELVSPPETYRCEEVGEAGSRAVRVGPNFLASPQESGIAEPLDFRAPEPATVVKNAGTIPSNMSRRPVAKRRAGLFTDLVCSPMENTNFMSPAPVTKRGIDEVGGFGIVD